MNLTSRIGDYGIIGTFFLLIMVVGSIVVNPGFLEQSIVTGITLLEELFSLAPVMATPLASLIAALALISVFFIGLVIDLLGFYSPSLEVVSFRRQIEKQREWLVPFFNKYDILLADEIKAVIDGYHPSSSAMESLREMLTTLPFSKRYWQILARNFRGLRVTRESMRLLTFLIHEGLRTTNDANSQFLLERYRLWRVSRALSTSLILAIVEAYILLFTSENFAEYPLTYAWAFIKMNIFYIVCLGLAAGLTLRSFHQVCETVLMLNYINIIQELDSGSYSQEST